MPDSTEHQSALERFESSPTAERITDVLISRVKDIAEACGAAAVFVYVDALEGEELPFSGELRQRVFYVTKTPAEDRDQEQRGTQFIHVPNVPLTRMGQVKIAVFLAVARGLIHPGDVVVCLSGVPASGTLDTLIVMQVGREFEMFAQDESWLPAGIQPEVVDRVIDLGAQLGNEGREGKPVGAIFVVGDAERVLALSRQLILNPFRGYPEQERNILDRRLTETVKELSTIDGAFIVRGDGVIETCGALLKTASQFEYELPRGLGARHHAAAAITALTDSVAVTVSESTGTVTVFRGGRILTELEKPRDLNRITSGLRRITED